VSVDGGASPSAEGADLADGAAGAGAPGRPFTHYLVAIVALALVIRFAYVFLYKWDEVWKGDQIYYSGQARWLTRGEGWRWDYKTPVGLEHTPAGDHPPLTSILMAPVSWFGDTTNLRLQRLLMAVLGTVNVVLIATLARRLGGARVGILAGLVAAFYPNLWLNDGVIMAETPAILATTVFLLTAYKFFDAPSTRGAVLLGFSGALMGLARSELVVVAALVLVPAFLLNREWRQRAFKPLVGAAAVFSVTLGLWVVPNLVRFEEPVLLSTNDGLTIAGTNCQSSYYGNDLGFWYLGCAQAWDDELTELDQSQRSSFLRRKGVRYMADNLDRLPFIAAVRVGSLWSVYNPTRMAWLNQGEGREMHFSLTGLYMYYAMVPLAVVGAFAARRRGVRLWPLLAIPVLLTLVAAAFYGLLRFRAPAEISLIILASLGVAKLLGWPPGEVSQPVSDPVVQSEAS
jgi:4-amino-4-deoxy-L-arabinose transferase-like glycosyltransferase